MAKKPPKGALPRRAPGTNGHATFTPLPSAAVPPVVVTTLQPFPTPPKDRRFRDLQEEIRLSVWDEWQAAGYTPWRALRQLAQGKRTSAMLRFLCHKELMGLVLAKLKNIEIAGQVDHHHTVEPALALLFAQLEEEEAQERETLPPWTPPRPEVLDMEQGDDGAWDLEEE